MNYLAHLLLGDDDGPLLVGSFAGDFVRGHVARLALPTGVRAGIRLHRHLDSLTDRHPAGLAARRALPPERRRVAGILVDLAFDHFLARDWDLHSNEPLEVFAARCYRVLVAYSALLPARADTTRTAMTAGNWLCGYRHQAGVVRAAEGIAPRLSQPALLRGGGAAILAAYDDLEAAFQAFFPVARRAAAAWHTADATRSQA